MLQLTRISILLFYLTALGKDVRIVVILLIVASILFGSACTIVEFLQCRPASMLWLGKKPAEYSCIDQAQFFRITGLINLIRKCATVVAVRTPSRSPVSASCAEVWTRRESC